MKMYEAKSHLNPEGRAQMEALKRGMNTGRKSFHTTNHHS